jgi:hypothetical protein
MKITIGGQEELDEVARMKAEARAKAEKKSADAPTPSLAYTDEELDAMTSDFTEEDVKNALASSTPEMRGLLGAKKK